MSFFVSHISLNIMPSRFICIVTNGKTSFCYMAEYYFIDCIPHHLYPLVDQWTPRLPSVSQLSALPQLYPNFGLICINLFSFLNLPKLFFSIFICCMALMFYSEKYPVCVCVCGERGRHVCLSVGVYLCECIFL